MISIMRASPAGCRLKHDRSEHGDFHFVRRLHPANQFIKVVQRKRVQDLRGEIHFGAMQIVFAQNQAERLHGKKITAAGVAQNVAPSARSLDPVAAASGYR